MIQTIIGILGMCMILCAFIMEDFGVFKKHHVWFNVLNFFGSICLIIYAIYTDSPIFIALNGIWAIIAVYFVMRKK